MSRTTVLLLLLVFGFHSTVSAQDSDQKKDQPAEKQRPELLFVQDAAGMKFEGDTLTLTNAKPHVVYFSDRPDRMAGHTTIEEMKKHVAASFEKDPPNAALVVLDSEITSDVVITLTKPPTLQGKDLVFAGVKIISGKPKASAGPCAMFIDGFRGGPRGPGIGRPGPGVGHPGPGVGAPGPGLAPGVGRPGPGIGVPGPRGPLDPRGAFDPRGPMDPRGIR